MSINLNEGQEFFVGGKRYVVKDGQPVQEAKRGPLGGELVRADEINASVFNCGGVAYLQLVSEGANDGDTRRFRYNYADHYMCPKIIHVPIDALLEINVPQSRQGRVMTAGEAWHKRGELADKEVLIRGRISDFDFDFDDNPIKIDFCDNNGPTPEYYWFNKDAVIEVLD